jgi:hypothetical protein
MNRIKDYAGFAVWFIGLGTIVLWPVALRDSGLFAGSAVCRGDSSALSHWLCSPAQPAMLSPGLQLIGLLSAAFVIIRILFFALLAARQRLTGGKPPPRALPRRRRPAAMPAKVKPRTQFGLRGVSH